MENSQTKETPGSNVLVCGADGSIRWAGNCAARMFSAEPGDLLGKRLAPLLDETGALSVDRAFRNLRSAPTFETAASCSAASSEPLEVHPRDGSPGDPALVLHLAAVKDADARQVVVLVRRPRDSRWTDARFNCLDRSAVAAVLASSIGHEAGNALSAIVGNLYLLRRKAGDAMTTSLDRIDAEVERLSRLNERMLELGRRDRVGRQRDVDVGELLRRVLRSLSESGHTAGCDVHTDFSARDAVVRGNPGELEQLFLNVLINAVEATSGQGRVEISMRDGNGDALEITIADNGPGMPEEQQRLAFTPFFSTKADRGDAAGLGLSVARSIANRGGATLDLRDREGGGVVFRVRFRRDQG